MLLALAAFAHAATLDEAWAAADRSGVDTQLVEEQYKATKTLTGAAWSLVSPKFVLRGNYTLNDKELVFDSSALVPENLAGLLGETDPVVIQKKSYFDANASIVQPLFSGQALPLLRAAYGEVSAANEDRRGQRGQLRLGVARAYWGVVLAREGVQIAREALTSAQKHRTLADATADVGLAAPTLRLQARIAESRAERELAAAEEGRVTAEQALARLTNLPPDEPVSPPPSRTLRYDTVEAAISAAATARPSVRAAHTRSVSAQAQALARTMAWLPDVNGRFTYVWTENTSAFNDREAFWMVVVEGEWVLWDGGYRLSEQAKAAAQKRMASLAEARALDEAEAELRTLWEQHTRATKALGTVERELELAKENLRLAEVAWQAGALKFIELEDARLGEKAARLGVLQERMNASVAALGIEVAVEGG
jgi:outer membrane protein TolC